MVVHKITEIYSSTTIIKNKMKHISKLGNRASCQVMTAFVCIHGHTFVLLLEYGISPTYIDPNLKKSE